MEDQQNGYIYEIASPLELGVADYRDQALIVWRHGDDKRRPSWCGWFPQRN